MKKILTASSNSDVIKTVENACKKYSSYFSCVAFSSTEELVNYLDFEMPEIKVLDFTSSDVDAEKVLATINEDPWFHYGGIICVCNDDEQVAEVKERKNANIIAAQTLRDFTKHFSRILRILWQNQQFLFNRGLQDIIGGQESGSFICGNDPMDIQFYTNFLTSYLYNTNRINEEGRFNLQIILMELLINALEHGNLEISYDEKSRWLQQGGDVIDLIEQRTNIPKYSERKIKIIYKIGRAKSRFSIFDDGDGFNWKPYLNKNLAPTTGLIGRGIQLSVEIAEKIAFNEKGNQVTFEIANLRNAINDIPGIMKKFDTFVYSDKQILVRQNEMSNDLLFMVSGRFAVYADKKLVSVLTPNDMFIGEMAFLLNDRRTATVLAVGDCKVIRIPKDAFLTLIRHNPHYGIFLSRILAQRLLKQTQKTVSLQEKLDSLNF